MERVFGLLAVENLLNGEDLQSRVAGAVRGFVESGFCGFLEHGSGGFLEGNKDADFGFFAFEGSAQKLLLFIAFSVV